jgi:hypothetical protein
MKILTFELGHPQRVCIAEKLPTKLGNKRKIGLSLLFDFKTP